MGKILGCKANLFVKFVLFLMFGILFSVSASALTVNIVNSDNWVDVYSVMLYSTLENEHAFFLNSESLSGITRIIDTEKDIITYNSKKDPFINKFSSQLSSMGYNVMKTYDSDNFNLDLDVESGKYILVGEDNYRMATALVPLAVKTGAWVFIVNEDNVKEIVKKIENAGSVIAVGDFRRSVATEIEKYITKRINNNNIYDDSFEVATMIGNMNNVVLTDGSVLEKEFFTTLNPILISGHNKILDKTFAFLKKNNVKSIVIVGNNLAVVGEQIRAKSNKDISVFIKYGQAAPTAGGEVFALMMFPLPVPVMGLTVDKVIYNPVAKELIVNYNNFGNIGIYFLTTLKVISGEKILGDTSDDNNVFIGSGEILQIRYPATLSVSEINDETLVEFFTSYGTNPTQLDTFLTMTNKYGPPFSIGLDIQNIEEDDSEIEITNVVYIKGSKRLGVTIENTGDVDVYYDVKVNQLIVNGIPKDFRKEGSVVAGESKVVYFATELDSIDIEENKDVNVVVTYGADKELLLKTIKKKFDFVIKGGLSGITGNVVLLGGEGSPVFAIIVVILIAFIGFRIYKKNKRK